ncbi:transposase [Olivibacter sitiensis]|uniref:transposase n=1 Tax=Olivibacter sitiensis TaxID=376470 RepID=UPI0004098F2C|nr:transposase [Olivibacter sitiensis]
MKRKLNRRSIRLKGYDYSQAGLYFVTICVQNRRCLFGDVVDGEMVLNDAGNVAHGCWAEIPEHFPNVVLHEYVIMPNHLHGIIELTGPVGAKYFSPKYFSPENMKSIDSIRPTDTSNGDYVADDDFGANVDSPLRSPANTIGSVIRGFKIGVTKWVRQNTDIYHLWQRNYFEHIIRSQSSYHRIAQYIVDNPLKWQEDNFFVP